MIRRSKEGAAEPLKPIERDDAMDREYIPFGAGWGLQTKGNGSTVRLSDGRQQFAVSCPIMEAVLPRMALEVRSVVAAKDARIAELEAALAGARDAALEDAAVKAWATGMILYGKQFDAQEIGAHCAAAIRAMKGTRHE